MDRWLVPGAGAWAPSTFLWWGVGVSGRGGASPGLSAAPPAARTACRADLFAPLIGRGRWCGVGVAGRGGAGPTGVPFPKDPAMGIALLGPAEGTGTGAWEVTAMTADAWGELALPFA